MSTSVSETRLQANALGLLSTAALTAAYMAPALSVYALFGAMTAQVGVAVGFVMALGLLMTLPSAVSFGMLAKEMPSAGGVYVWTCRALGESLGLWVGLAAACYYTLTLVFPPIVFGQFLNEILKLLGFQASVWTWLLGVVLSLLIASSVTYRGIVVSSHLALAMLMTELAVVVALAATFIGVAIVRGTFSWAPILPTAAKGAWSGIFLALPLALLSMSCDAVTPASEETRDAKWTIPLALVTTCVLIGLWHIVGFSAFALAASPEEVSALVTQQVATPITPLAERVWGPFKVLVTITGMTAAIGALVPCSTAASRVLFAMGRDGTLPRWLGSVHPRYRAPWNALHVIHIITVAAVVPLALWFGVTKTIDWWGSSFAWFIALVYIFANLSNAVFYWRFRRQQFHVAWNLLIPLIGIGAQCLVIWRTVVVELWKKGWFGRSAQIFILVVAVLTAAYVCRVRRRQPVCLPAADAGDANDLA